MVASNDDPVRLRAQNYIASRYRDQIEDKVFAKLVDWLGHKKYRYIPVQKEQQFRQLVKNLVDEVCKAHTARKEDGSLSVGDGWETAKNNLKDFLRQHILVDAFPIPAEKVVAVLERYTHELILHPERMVGGEGPAR